jgi:hypothetical protein
MSWRKILFVVFVTVLLFLPPTVSACPSCADAVPDTSDADALDQARESQAYNHSIYLMVGTPYLLLGGLGLLIYRGYRQQAKQFAGAGNGGIGHVLPPLPTDAPETVAPDRSDR